MCFQALASIRNVKAPTSSALLLLFILADYAGPDGCCYPSQATLADRSQLSLRAVRANLSHLRHAKLISQEQRRRKDGSRTSDLITLLYYAPEQAADSAACDVAKKPRKDKEVLPRRKRQIQPLDKRQNSTGQAAPVAGLTTFEPTSEAITPPAEREPSSGFDEFWKIFPSDVEERGSRAIFERIVKNGEATADELIYGARHYARQVRGRDPNFIKHATTWLQRACWTSAPPPADAEAPAGAAGFPRTGFAGPAELRRAVVDVRDEAWARSWLDPSGWDAEAKQIIPRNAFAGDRIRQDIGRHLRAWGLGVGQPQRTAQ